MRHIRCIKNIAIFILSVTLTACSEGGRSSENVSTEVAGTTEITTLNNTTEAALSTEEATEKVLEDHMVYFISETNSEGKKNYEMNTDGEYELNYTFKALMYDNSVILMNGNIESAVASVNQDYYLGVPFYCVTIKFTETGAKLFADITKRAVEAGETIAICVDGKIISAPKVETEITEGITVINGLESWEEAEEIAGILNNLEIIII